MNELAKKPDNVMTQEAAQKRLDEAKKELEQLDKLSVNAKPSFPLIENALMEMQINLNHVSTRLWQISQLGDQLDRGKATAKWIHEYGDYLSSKLRFVGALKHNGRFDEAITALKECKIPSELRSFRFASLFLELAPWIEINLHLDKAEAQNKASLCPLTDEEYDNCVQLIQGLKFGLHARGDKAILEDRLRGIYFLRAAYKLDHEKLTSETLETLANHVQEYQYRDYRSSALTQWRYYSLRYRLVDSYNKGCVDYFDLNPEYKDALCFFHHKSFFRNEEILHKAYLSCEDDDSFRVAFLHADLMRKNEGDFYEEAASIVSTISKDEDIPSRCIADVFADPALDDARKQTLLKEISASPFPTKVFVFDAAMSKGISESDEEMLLEALEANRGQRKADLEKVASALLNIRAAIHPSLSNRFDEVVDSLFRSSTAVKITVKTPINDVRTLSKFGFKDPPKGSKFNSRVVKARDFYAYSFRWFIAIIIALGITGAGYYFTAVYCPESFRPYVYIAPALFLLIFILVTVQRNCGTDERGSAYARRALGIAFFLLSVLTLLYFIFPTTLIGLKDFGYTLIIGVTVMTLSTMVCLKDYKSRFGFWTYWPTMLVLVASLVFLIIDMMNGLI